MGVFAVAGEGIFKWSVQSKDGVRLHIDDKTLIENDGVHDAAVKTGYLHLAEGVHARVLDSFNSKGAPFLKLLVTPPVGQEQIFSSEAVWLDGRNLQSHTMFMGSSLLRAKRQLCSGTGFQSLDSHRPSHSS